MIGRTRAASAAFALACTLALPAHAQQTPATQPHGPSAAPLTTLPANTARPPASRVPRTDAAQPVRAPVVRRPAVQPALDPTTPLDETPLRANGETYAQITREAANRGRPALPVGPGLRGPTVLRVQVLLDRALFSPGMIDGNWGKNTGMSVYWFQASAGLPATGIVDSATYARLEQAAGRPDEIVVRRALRPEEVRGPFTPIPSSIYEQAKLNCSCYENLTEQLTELFHLRAELLQKLNPGVRIDELKAGDTLNVLNVRDRLAPPKGVVETLVVSGADHYLQALDANGRILYHFPTTLGSSYDPSPEGSFHVLAITEGPWWHYQPAILKGRDPNAPEAHIPPGPNSAVGRVWMTLSAEHYGIHGTKSPETIGYAVSAGCVRLTNWDVLYLARRLTPGTPVVFRGTRTPVASRAVNRGRPAAPARADSTRARPAPARPDTTRRDTTRAPAHADTTRKDTTARPAALAPAPAPAPAKPDSATPPPVQPDSAAKP